MTAILDDFSWKPCNRGTAYEFFPKKETKIDMDKAAELLSDFEIEMSSKFLILLVINGKTVSVFSSGKIMIRGEKDEKKARELAETVLKKLEEMLK